MLLKIRSLLRKLRPRRDARRCLDHHERQAALLRRERLEGLARAQMIWRPWR